jgi:hypothetical protein
MATRLAGLVGDPARCAIVVVTQAEEMPVQETLELEQTLVARLGRGADVLVVNALFPPLPSGVASAADPALAHWRRRRQVNERELARLRAAWTGNVVELLLLPFERGPELVAELGRRLAAAGSGPGAWL